MDESFSPSLFPLARFPSPSLAMHALVMAGQVRRTTRKVPRPQVVLGFVQVGPRREQRRQRRRQAGAAVVGERQAGRGAPYDERVHRQRAAGAHSRV